MKKATLIVNIPLDLFKKAWKRADELHPSKSGRGNMTKYVTGLLEADTKGEK